ncbi:carboxylesterase 1-like [Prosopis cineraria]|uniref:carboxylesterase 1-like n=1 Tax=Prosopis cineraria TaxID=364024 RepID=UPI00240FFB53|nr:carboxylesterase 1-like [Prosopis cineraria]
MTTTESESLDVYKQLQIVVNDDGSLTRFLRDPLTLATSDPNLPISVLTRDLTINQSNNTWVRLFLLRKALDYHPSNKFPLIVFFHGGGFIYFSAASTRFHDFCSKMATDIEAVVASVEYRLAPEHRLPAAYDDAVEALHWIKTSPDDWLRDFVDYSNCYVMGDSAGGTIAYHAGLRVAEEVNDLKPMKIKGLILRQPFFGGTQRTESEVRLEKNPVVPMCWCDLFWELALPVGANCDHEYSNPTAADQPEKMEKIREMGWKVMVSGNGGDPLVDRGIEMARLMEEKGVNVVIDFEEEGSHGVEFADDSVASKLIGVLKQFISSSED